MKMRLFTFVLLFGLMACSNGNNDSDPIENPTPKEQWGKTLVGSDETIAAYPDLYVNYWEYTCDLTENPNVALRIRGEYPKARFFSFSLYNDERGDAIGGIDDYDIEPDEGCENPFLKTSSQKNVFTIYVIPPQMEESQLAKIKSKNICKVDEGVKRLTVCIRQYLGVDEYGGVELPAIEAIDIHSLKEVQAPLRANSNVMKFPVNYRYQASDNNPDMPFFLASKAAYYPNNSTDYLYARTLLADDSVLVFKFIPVSYPKTVEAYKDANARYWSICFGSALNTRSYYSVCDKEANVPDGESCTFVVCMKQNQKLEDIREKVKNQNAKGEHWQLIEWDREKKDFEGKAIGNNIVTMYRQILPNADWEYSISRMKVTPYGDPVNNVTDPNKQLAHKALGEYGPYGFKFPTDEFLSDKFALPVY